VSSRLVRVRLGQLEERPELFAQLRGVLVPVYRCSVLDSRAHHLVLFADARQRRPAQLSPARSATSSARAVVLVAIGRKRESKFGGA
jgi:hypothetical protein